jgi:hypothetical protein
MEKLEAIAVVCCLCVFVNLCLLGFTIKLFTEHVKDRLQEKRKHSPSER